MNKRFIKLFILFILFISGAFYISTPLQTILLELNQKIVLTYHDKIDTINNTINEHFLQKEKIQQLTIQLEDYKNSQLLMHQFTSQLNNLLLANKSQLRFYSNVELVKTISYSNLSDFTKVWIDMPDFNSSKIYGLIHNDTVAGIVINKNSKPLALLNANQKSSYAVFVGLNNAPGVTHGRGDNFLVVDFIPTWMSINIGDEIVTSGLDKLFFPGLRVGKVISVSTQSGYQSAIVEPYFKAIKPSYFHLIKGF